MIRVAVLGADAGVRRGLEAALAGHAELAEPGSAALTLLAGLVRLPSDRQARRALEAADTRLRNQLAQAGTGFQVLYGTPGEMQAQALDAIDSIALQQGMAGTSGENPSKNRLWTWVCDNCSDPDCEHRLFTGRLGRPAAAGRLQ